jgi:hypothetical protein
MFKSLFDLVTNTAQVVLAPIQIVTHLANEVVAKPAAALAQEAVEAMKVDLS